MCVQTCVWTAYLTLPPFKYHRERLIFLLCDPLKDTKSFFFTPGFLFSPSRWEKDLQGHDFLFHVGNLTEMKTQTHRPTIQLHKIHESVIPSLMLWLVLLKKHSAAALTYIYLKQIKIHNFLYANLPEPLINPISAN